MIHVTEVHKIRGLIPGDYGCFCCEDSVCQEQQTLTNKHDKTSTMEVIKNRDWCPLVEICGTESATSDLY